MRSSLLKTKQLCFRFFLYVLGVISALVYLSNFGTHNRNVYNQFEKDYTHNVIVEETRSVDKELPETSQRQWVIETQGNGISSAVVANTSIGVNTSETIHAMPQSEVEHIAFLKVHKTASTSVQNVLIRFGESRNLTFILGSLYHSECGRRRGHCISPFRSLYDRNITPPPNNKTFDLLCSHVIYDRDRFRYYLPSDSKYISIIREPARRLESAISFFKLKKATGGSLTAFAKNATRYKHHKINNWMAFEFGFKREWFPNVTHKQLSVDETTAVHAYVDQLFQDFDLIMITERIDESLVLMKRLFRWNIEDIIYQKKLVRRHAKFKQDDEPMIREYLYLDYLLYDRAVTTLKKKIANAGPDFQDEVKSFQEANIIVNKLCQSDRTMRGDVTVPGTRGYTAFTVTRQLCESLSMKESIYLLNIRIRQYGPLKKRKRKQL